jgi:phosphoribosylanthranilate isomerase
MAQQKVKVCGMREAENIREVEALGVDLMGFIFWPKSSRYVSERPDYLPTKCKRVGVFVDENIAQVKAIANEYSLDYIQLHGKENTDYVKTLEGYHLIKAFNIAIPEDFKACQAYEGLVDFFLFDTKGKSVGGNGEKFDWSVLSAYQGDTPFLLSGGISPDDAASVRAIHHPKFAGVDLNSRFEIEPALKNVEQLRKFIKGL